MDIAEVSKKVYRFQKERVATFGVQLTPEIVFFHLCEEIGEIARQLVNKNLPMRDYDENGFKEDYVEVMRNLLDFSYVFNINLSEALDRKMDDKTESRIIAKAFIGQRYL